MTLSNFSMPHQIDSLYTIPNIDNSTDKTIAITKAEAKWIKKNMKPIELKLIGWLKEIDPADILAVVSGDLRIGTQATRTRLKQKGLIGWGVNPDYSDWMRVSEEILCIPPLMQPDLDATRKDVLGADNFIEIRLRRTGTIWEIAPIYFNDFLKNLLNLALSTPKKVKLPLLKSSPDWSFTPAANRTIYTIPNIDSSTDTGVAITKAEADWIEANLKPIKLELVGAGYFIEVKLQRTETVWQIAPFFFNQFCKNLIDLALTKPKIVKLPAPKPSSQWSFTPTTA